MAQIEISNDEVREALVKALSEYLTTDRKDAFVREALQSLVTRQSSFGPNELTQQFRCAAQQAAREARAKASTRSCIQVFS